MKNFKKYRLVIGIIAVLLIIFGCWFGKYYHDQAMLQYDRESNTRIEQAGADERQKLLNNTELFEVAFGNSIAFEDAQLRENKSDMKTAAKAVIDAYTKIGVTDSIQKWNQILKSCD